MAKTATSHKAKPTINVAQVIDYLTRQFEKNSSRFDNRKSKVVRGTQLYKYQVDFSYLIDEIQRGPTGLIPKVITEANELLTEMESVEIVEGTYENGTDLS